MNPTPTSHRLRILQLGLTLLALWGFYAGFRLFQDMLAPPPLESTADKDGFVPPTASAVSQANTLPRHLPWPKYPGARPIHFGRTEHHQGKTMIQTLESAASSEKIVTWYRKQLTRKGWTTKVSDKGGTSGRLAAPAELLKEHPEVFQQEKVLRMIDAFQSNILIMRKKSQVLFLTVEPSPTPRRQNIQVVWYDIDPKPEPSRSAYAKRHISPSLPYNQHVGQDDLSSTTIASHLSPDAHLAQWRNQLRGEGWEEKFESEKLAQFARMPGVRAAFFTRGNNGTVIAIQPGPENGSMGLITRIQ